MHACLELVEPLRTKLSLQIANYSAVVLSQGSPEGGNKSVPKLQFCKKDRG